MTLQQAQQCFVATAARRWLTPTEITPALIEKADAQLVGVAKVDGDALSDVSIEFTANVKSSHGLRQKKYKMPIAVYLLTSDSDISDDIRDLLLERIALIPADEIYRKLCLRYAISAIQHLDDKNMAHYLMEDAKLLERPNKLKVLNRLLQFDYVRNSHYKQFEEREEWTGPNFGYPCSQEYESLQYLMDSAVYSGDPANVEFAIKNGLTPRYLGNSYGGPTMAYVCNYAWQEPYEKIAYLLVEHAQETGRLKELVEGSYRKGSRSISCIESLSKAGLVDLVALCGAVGAGKPVYDCEIEQHQHYVTEAAGYDVVNWNSTGWQPARSYTRTISVPVFRLVGREVVQYLKGAIFRNLRGDGTGWDSRMYGLAVGFLGITPPADDDEGFIPFCLALRSAVVAESAVDATFLVEEVNFTEAFRTRALAAVAGYC